MNLNLGNMFQHWAIIVPCAFIGVSLFQWFAVYPLEVLLLSGHTTHASVLFLPHAVRVLSTVILGPRAFFALLPGVVISQHLYYLVVGGSWDFASTTFAILGAASAPVAYLLMERLLDSRIDYRAALLNWRFVFLVGIVASMINSTSLAVLLMELRDVSEIFRLMLRTFVGDLGGLFLGLVVLTWIFRMLRKVREGDV